MALPHQVGLKITYDGTIKKLSEVTTKEKSNSITYTIRQGDTLWDLARQYYGSGTKENIIYDANKDILEKTARKYGKSSAKSGRIIWIYPGTVITIPNISGNKTTTKKAFVKTGTANSKLGSKIADQASGFTYTDVASGQSDSVSITLSDIDKEWLGNLMPKKGAQLGAKLVLTNWNEEEKTEKFNCGTFVLDDISFSGRPLNCVLNGVSVPTVDDFKSEDREETWESTTIKEIASKIAKKYYLSLYYDADTVKIEEVEQNSTDSSFLYSLCEKYGLAMKVYNNKIVIFDIVKYEQKASVATLKESDLLSWDYNTTVNGTYTGVTLEYTDPDSDDDEPIKVTIGSKGRMYKMNSQASSKYDAELQARAKVNAANRDVETMTVTIRGNISIVASQCVKIKGLGKANGKYYVDKAKHSVGGKYTTQLTMHKVQDAIGYPKKGSSSSKGGSTYTVQPGDNLWNLAKKYYGSGTKQTIIYNANKDIIEATAKKYGRSNSKNGWWIYPGTVLTIPEV